MSNSIVIRSDEEKRGKVILRQAYRIVVFFADGKSSYKLLLSHFLGD